MANEVTVDRMLDDVYKLRRSLDATRAEMDATRERLRGDQHRIHAFLAGYGEASLRADYIAGRIDVKRFEAALDRVLGLG